MICEQCGEEYERIGHHWSQSFDCSMPRFSERQHEIITGSLMGDGTLDIREGRNPRVTVGVQEKEYIEYIKGILYPLSGKVYKSGGLWWISTRNHEELDRYASWYSEKGKRWPEDLKITPTILRHLYAQDGSTQYQKTPIARICTRNEQDSREKVSEMFLRSGLPEPRWNYNQFRWSVEESKDVFEFMGKSVPGYEYKWPTQYRKS